MVHPGQKLNDRRRDIFTAGAKRDLIVVLVQIGHHPLDSVAASNRGRCVSLALRRTDTP